MPTLNEALRKVHELRTELADAKDQLHRGPLQIKGREADLAKKRAAVQAIEEAAKSIRKQADARELILKTGENRHEDLKAKLNQASSNKEYAAIQEEMGKLKSANSAIEDEVLELLGQYEEKMVEVKQAQADFKVAEEDAAKFKEVVAYRMDKFRERLGILEAALQAAENDIPGPAQMEYRKLVKLKGEKGLAGCDNGICSVCYTQQPPQNWNNLCNNEVTVCNSCAALLYRSS